ncbi:hypothetical protein E2C01_000143 [Portunus trituberculatus]|uniref:Uncharacterized protein n=1 Tax=Portunus trituberculatus TaxID=210409 RepID=A0A5B7CDI4_PORTR|nr:hypothetical protein [Portunus trituberculatus]
MFYQLIVLHMNRKSYGPPGVMHSRCASPDTESHHKLDAFMIISYCVQTPEFVVKIRSGVNAINTNGLSVHLRLTDLKS